MGYFPAQVNFSSRPQYAIRLQVTTSYTPGGTVLSIYNVLVKHTYVNNSPNTTGSPKNYSVTNGRYPNLTSDLGYSSDSDSTLTFSFTFGSSTNFVEQIFPIWGGSGTFTRYIRDSDSIGSVTVGASHSLLGNASASVTVKHVYRTTFDANGGSVGTSSRDDDSGTSFSLPTPSRSGYNFDGWLKGGSNIGSGSYSVSSTETLVASWSLSTPAPVFSDPVNNYGTVRVGQGFGDQITASNATSYALITAPSGLYLQDYGSTAYIFGSIDATSSGSGSITVRAYGPGGNTDSSDTFTLKQALPVWTDATLSNARVGSSYTSGNTFSASGATSWVISGIPSGLSSSGTASTTVTISGTPSSAGSYTIYATPYNSDGDAGSQVAISLYISPRVPAWVDTTLTTSARVGVSYSSTVSANYVTSWNDGTLPLLGLSFSGTTSATSTGVGTVSGTPTNYGTASFSITPSNSDAETPGARSFSIIILDAALSWSDQILVSSVATQDTVFSDGVAVQSGPVSVTYSTTPGFLLPPGLSVDPNTGAITGTPTAPGTYSFKIRATNGSSEVLDTSAMSLTIEAAGGYVQVKTAGGWQNAVSFVKTSGGWVEGTVNAKSGTGWDASFTS